MPRSTGSGGGRHRGVPAPLQPPEPPRARDVAWRAVLVAAGLGWGGIVVGGKSAFDPATGPGQRVLGALGAVLGVVVVLSLWFYAWPGFLAGTSWQRTSSRRRAVWLVRHLWMAVTAAAFITLCVWRIVVGAG